MGDVIILSRMAQNLKRLLYMSKHNNVNPGQYKVGGRLHPGDDSSKQQQEKAQASIEEHQLREESRRAQDKQD